jgi:hypothetical protein
MKEETMKESMNTCQAASAYQATNAYQATSGREASLSVLVPEAVWRKMMAYVNICDYEINGFGYVTQLDESTVQVEDVFILKQAVNAGSAVTEPGEVASHITQMIEQGKDTSSLRFQWHSHVRMQAYFSGTDTGTIDAYANCDWMISLVLNKREEFAVRLDVYQPFRISVPVTLKRLIEEDDELLEACAREIKEKVRLRMPARPVLQRRDQRKEHYPYAQKAQKAQKGGSDEELGGLWRPARTFRPF